MSDKAAFKAEYTNFKPVPSRGKIQIVFEAPIENGNHIIAILGMPDSSKSEWYALAKLEQVSAPSHALVSGGETPAAANGGVFFPLRGDVPEGNEGKPAQQPEPKKNYTGAAKSLARNPVFWDFLECNETKRIPFGEEAKEAEKYIELACDVKSCAAIQYGTPAGDAMSRLLADFYRWEEFNQQGETR